MSIVDDAINFCNKKALNLNLKGEDASANDMEICAKRISLQIRRFQLSCLNSPCSLAPIQIDVSATGERN